MNDIKLDGAADSALNHLQDTTLTPMEEALFQAWTKANKIDKPDAPDKTVDYRGIYQQTRGAILPYGELKRMTDKADSETKLQRVLQERMLEHISNKVGDVDDEAKMKQKSIQQDKTHKQKLELQNMKLKQMPHEHKSKELDLQKANVGVESQKIGNEAKKLDITKVLVTPPAQSGGASGSTTNSSGK